MSTFLYCLKQGVINICRNIWFSLASVATISACIFLFCLFFAMVANVQHGARAAEETVGISVFFDEGMDEEQIRSIGSQIQSWSEVREARYISAEEAWESFKSEYFEGMEELAEGFEADNPLANSSSYEIYLKDISDQDMIVKRLEGMEGVRKVRYSSALVAGFTSAGKMIGALSAVIIGVLLAVAIFLISNTISVAAAFRRRENEIMRYIGATNFMIRDELMQRVVNREEEPIIPFIDRVSELYEREGISTILVAGSSGSYFHKADTVIQMKQYLPVEITDFVKKEAEQFPLVLEHIAEAKLPSFERIVKRDVAFQKENRIKMKALGKEAVSVNREEVDLRLVEQLTDHEQLEALVQILKYMKLHMFDGKRTLQEAVEELYTAMQKKEFAAFCTGGIPGNLALPRKQEIYAVLNRCRGLLKIE